MKINTTVGAVEIAGDEVRLAVVKTSGRLPTVLELHTGHATYPSVAERPAALTGVVQSLIREVKAKATAYVLCVSGQWCFARQISIPLRGRRVGPAVRYQLEPFLAFPIEELAVDYSVIREVNGSTEVLAVGMRKALVEEQLAFLQEAGLDPEGIDLDVAGLTTLWRAGQRDATGLQAVLHVREGGSILAVVSGKTLAFFRPLGVTDVSFHQDVPGVIREVQNSLRAFQATWKAESTMTGLTVTGVGLTEEERGQFDEVLQIPVKAVALVGQLKGPGLEAIAAEPVSGLTDESASQAAGAGAEEMAQAAIPFEEAAASSQGESSASTLHDDKERWGAVIGVALGAAGGGMAFNLRKDDLQPVGQWRGVIRHAVFSVSLAVLALLGYIGYCYVDYRRNVAETERIGGEIVRILKETFPNSEAAQPGSAASTGGLLAYDAMDQERNKLREADDTVSLEIFSEPTLLDVLTEINDRLSSDVVTISDIRIKGGRSAQITIGGEIKSPDQFTQAFANLKTSELFTVSDEDLTRNSEGGRDRFTITAYRRPAGDSSR
ncbi:MAG: pilus assembly protein PilM [Candidatus Hydrogenedentes bacterium]|nr:pilus assembly protein PilM [Candidatus Hydrogenedentota bacterium]